MWDQEWTDVSLKKKTKAVKPKNMSSSELEKAKSQGIITTEKKWGAGKNSSVGSSNARKLEEHGTGDEEVSFKVETIDISLSKAIIQARNAKKMTQKQLATAINEQPRIIQDMENGKAKPNGQVLSKLDRALGVRLPRPHKGKK
jgi:putative transcription factor